MEEEKYKILSDLRKIEAILKKKNLQDERVRKQLTRLLCNSDAFHHRIGALFVESLTKIDNYKFPEYQKKVLDDCRNFINILSHCKTDQINEIIKLQHLISDKDNLLFQSWMQKPAIYYINGYFENKKGKLYLKANQNQNYDLTVIYSLSSKYAFDQEDDANRLYKLLLRHKGKIFKSWIGIDFVEKIQKRTTEYKKLTKRRKILRKTTVVCAVSAILVFFPLTYMYVNDYKNNVEAKELDTIRSLGIAGLMQEVPNVEIRENEEDEILEEYQKLRAINADLIGWLKIEGLTISLPVMQKIEEDDFYLDHNFYQESEKRGALFVDAMTTISPMSKIIVIYGHNMSDGTMFGKLRQYEDRNFYQENSQFTFDTVYNKGIYDIVGVVRTHVLKKDDDGFRYYQFYNYENQEEFQEFIDFIKQYQLYDTGIDIAYGDTFVILSTCEYSTEQGRLLVIGRCLKNGES